MHDSWLFRVRIALVTLLVSVLFASGCSSHTTGNPNETNSPQPSVTVTGASEVRLGSSTTFTAAVANLTNTAVTWQVNTVAGGNSTVGTIHQRRRVYAASGHPVHQSLNDYSCKCRVVVHLRIGPARRCQSHPGDHVGNGDPRLRYKLFAGCAWNELR